MKRFEFAMSIAISILGLCRVVDAQGISDPKIVTYIHQIPGWNMQGDQNALKSVYIPGIAGLGNDQIIGIKTIINPDNMQEAFDLTRQTGFRDNITDGSPWRNGGYTELFRFDRQAGATNDMLAILDRGRCETGSQNWCVDFARRNFFTATYPMISGRSFVGSTNSRGKVKIDYICTANCPASTTKTMWLKLGFWNMDLEPSKNLTPPGITAANIANMDAVIYSDPGSGPQVDNLEHIAFKSRSVDGYSLTPNYRSRGGILWYGKGCAQNECKGGSDLSQIKLRVYAGHGGPNAESKKSSYRGAIYRENPDDPGSPIPYNGNGLANRGWAKIEYTGTSSSASQPYFMRTTVYRLGIWSMTSTFDVSIPLAGSGIDPYRITGLSTVIRSDKDYCGPDCMPGWTFTNFHRPDPGHKPQTSAKVGGVTYFDGNSGAIRVVMGGLQLASGNFYSQNPGYGNIRDENGQAFNRGHVRVDYLAAECQDGTGGYTRGIIGFFSANSDDCHGVKGTGSSANFVIQTKGPTLSMASDALYFAHKARPYQASYTATAKVMELENTGSAAKAGVMMRLNTYNNSHQASVVVTGSSVQFIRRANNGTSITTVNNVTAPCWVRVVKGGDMYKGYYSLDGNNWIRIGPDANITTQGGFLVGLAASGTGLTTSGFTNVSF